MQMFIVITIQLLVALGCYGKLNKPGCLKDHLIEEIERNIGDLKAMKLQSPDSDSSPRNGVTYTRWGKSSCPKHASLVYDGYAAGNHHRIGGSGTNFLCLPKNPEWKKYKDGTDNMRGRLYGVEYEIDGTPYSTSLHDKDMPCSVCLSIRSTVLMTPAKTTCHDGWHKEFSGYLMSQSGVNGRTPLEYICVDENLDSVPGGDASRNDAVIYSVESHCGSLKCPPYVSGRELTCVVCTK